MQDLVEQGNIRKWIMNDHKLKKLISERGNLDEMKERRKLRSWEYHGVRDTSTEFQFNTPTFSYTDADRADVSARGFWQRRQKAFVDVRIFYPFAQSYRNQALSATFRSMERTKKKKYTFPETMAWVKRKIRFGLLRTTVICLRGSRSSKSIRGYERHRPKKRR